jgi:hypothetical protein
MGKAALARAELLELQPSRPQLDALSASARVRSWTAQAVRVPATVAALRPLSKEARLLWQDTLLLHTLRGTAAMWRAYQAMACEVLQDLRANKIANIPSAPPPWLLEGLGARFPPSQRLHSLAVTYMRDRPRQRTHATFTAWCGKRRDVGTADRRRLWLLVLSQLDVTGEPLEEAEAASLPAVLAGIADAAAADGVTAPAAATPPAATPAAPAHTATSPATAPQATTLPANLPRRAPLGPSEPRAVRHLQRVAALRAAEGAHLRPSLGAKGGRYGWRALTGARDRRIADASLTLVDDSIKVMGRYSPFEAVAASLADVSGRGDGMVFSSGVVNACANMLVSAAPAQAGGPTRVLDSLAIGRLLDPATRAAAVQSVFVRLGRRIQDWGTLVVPIFYPPPPPPPPVVFPAPKPQRVGHWAMVVVRMRAGSMVMADSLSAVTPHRPANTLVSLAAALNRLLARDGLPPRVWSRVVCQRASQQDNAVDCGPLSVAALFPLLWDLAWTPPSRVPLLRRTLGYHLWRVGAEAVGRWDRVLSQFTRGRAPATT